ncbi:hypothetical protein [Arthrobacter mangrovi]|uniref:Uncharacterized protein n=1 Tax=Arthrobacter mangrovi TaxID=2966350 RepID=A0ABQ5MWQ8_9MICC|nr:hypothetical protein [Arthrobacter mangrovi]GLB68412.1 hypothetical protein AHIS1636_28540 [Arthrobacter mangrovi]
MIISRPVGDWNQPALMGATVDLRARAGQIREAGRVEAVHGDSTATIRFGGESVARRYSKRDWDMVLVLGQQQP